MKIIAAVIAPIRKEPVVFAGAIASLAQAGNQLASSHQSALGWVAAGVPLILAFVARFWTVPWAKVAPIFDVAATTTAQVFPATAKWDVVIAAAVDDAAKRATESGWPAPITDPATPVVKEHT